MDSPAIIGDDWPIVLSMMPSDFEASAVSKLALRRHREIASAGDLLRLALAYGLCDFSLRQVAAWAALTGLGQMSNVAVLKRLQNAEAWLGHLIVRWLQERGLATQVPALRVRIVDATVISQPGSQGTDWRLHVGLDLAQLSLCSLELTGPEGGETLRRFAVAPGEILLGDRGYGHREGIASVLDQAGHVVVRLSWQNCPLHTSAGKPLEVLRALQLLDLGEIGDWPVQLRVQDRVYALRLVAVRKTPAATAREQEQIRRAAAKKKRQPDPGSLRAAGYTCVLTDLPAAGLPAAQVLELYRLRWQIEIAFKRLKGLLHLDDLRAKGPQLARTYLFAKLLGALIVDELSRSAPAFSPWGYALFAAPPQSLALAEDVD
jgi:hypothetical protein